MTDQNAVKNYLRQLRQKIDVFGILIRDDRSKNAQTLLELEITSQKRENIIKNLSFEDYSDGPAKETLYGLQEMWIFGKLVKKKEIYIKITMGVLNQPVICISFHVASRHLKYPFKLKS